VAHSQMQLPDPQPAGHRLTVTLPGGGPAAHAAAPALPGVPRPRALLGRAWPRALPSAPARVTCAGAVADHRVAPGRGLAALLPFSSPPAPPASAARRSSRRAWPPRPPECAAWGALSRAVDWPQAGRRIAYGAAVVLPIRCRRQALSADVRPSKVSFQKGRLSSRITQSDRQTPGYFRRGPGGFPREIHFARPDTRRRALSKKFVTSVT
jgi:hypothetical protein